MEITSENHPLTNEGNHLQRRQQQYQHKILYAVQRYRHSGPRHYAPMDMLRLFHNQREAEEAAYHSAKAFYEATNTGANTNTNSSSSSIKTLLLPSSLPSNNPQGSSFGFLASGGLFWVRALRATIITTGVEIETHPVSESQSNSQSHSHNRPFYAIMTEGVIGGTGNPNSRRGMEIGDGRVFGGDATACAIAMGAVARVQQQVNCETTARTNRLRVEAKVVPVGKPPNADRWYSSGVFLKDCWAEEQVMSENFDAAMDDGSSSTTTTTKRQIHFSHSVFDCDQGYVQRSVSQEPDEGSQQSACLFVVDNNENLLVVDCPFEQPVAKRRRLVSVSEESYPSYNTNISINSNSNSNNFDYFGVMADISNGNQHDDDSVVMMQ